jgi:hypothetical protein
MSASHLEQLAALHALASSNVLGDLEVLSMSARSYKAMDVLMYGTAGQGTAIAQALALEATGSRSAPGEATHHHWSGSLGGLPFDLIVVEMPA